MYHIGCQSSDTWFPKYFVFNPSLFQSYYDLIRFMRNLPDSKSEHNGLQGLLHDHELEMLQSPGFKKLSDAFSMMQEEPSLQVPFHSKN